MKKVLALLLILFVSAIVFSYAVNTDWEVEHRLEIQASPATIWQLLSDFEHYPAWNRYSPKVTGKFEVGEQVTVEAHLGSRVQKVENIILSIKPEQELCWQSQDWFASLAQGLRCRWLTDQGNGRTLLVHHEVMAGPLAWLIEWIFYQRIEQGLRLVNESLAEEAERIAK